MINLTTFMKLAAALSMLVAAPQAAAATPGEIYVMRHLPKADGNDPPLTVAGVAQSHAVAEGLANSNVKAIFATKTRRAMETGTPLARKLGLEIQAYEPSDPGGLAAKVKALDGNVLIVGHSNTVPDLVERLSGAPQPPMTEAEYGSVFLIDGATRAVRKLSIADLVGLTAK